MTTTPGPDPTSTPDPVGEADEADVAEQQQSLDGEGAPAGEAVTDVEADEADALEQGAAAGSADDEEGYPRAGEAEEERH